MSLIVTVAGLTSETGRSAVEALPVPMRHRWTEQGTGLRFEDADTATAYDLAPGRRGTWRRAATDAEATLSVGRPGWYGRVASESLASLCAAAGVDHEAADTLARWRVANDEAVAVEHDLGAQLWLATDPDADRWFAWQSTQADRAAEDYGPHSPSMLWLLDRGRPWSTARTACTWAPGAAHLPEVDVVVIRSDDGFVLVEWDELASALGGSLVAGALPGTHLVDWEAEEQAMSAAAGLTGSSDRVLLDPERQALDRGPLLRPATSPGVIGR